MPNRILRDWTDSEPVNALDPWAERTFTRLIMKVDDNGCCRGEVKLLRPLLYPLLLDQVREADLSRQLQQVEQAGLVRFYDVGGKQYLQILNFRQRTRPGGEKYPRPPDVRQAPVKRPSVDRQQTAQGAGAVEGAGANPPSPPEGVGVVSAEGPPGFVRFWTSWPKHFRKDDRAKCLRRWERAGLEKLAGEVLAGLERWKGSRQWQKQDGDFIPAPLTWLNNSRWKTQDVPAAEGVSEVHGNGEFKPQFTAEMAEAAGVPFDPEGGAT